MLYWRRSSKRFNSQKLISKLSWMLVCDCVSDLKTQSHFWQLPEWTANFQLLWVHLFKIFTDLISLKEKQMECIWRITCSEEDVLHSCLADGIWQRHYLTIDLESNIVMRLVSPLEYTRKQQVQNLKNTHWRIESVLSLTWFFFSLKRVPDN